MDSNHIVVLPYNPAWKDAFLKIKEALEKPLSGKILRIEHVGSTAVEGLAAKPIIDLDIVIEGAAQFPAVKAVMEGMDYYHEGDLGLPGREAFAYDDKPEFLEHHLYVCYADSVQYKKHIVLRDYLRAHPDMRDAYAKVKLEGAALYPDDIDKYIAHKTPVIYEIYEKAGLAGYR